MLILILGVSTVWMWAMLPRFWQLYEGICLPPNPHPSPSCETPFPALLKFPFPLQPPSTSGVFTTISTAFIQQRRWLRSPGTSVAIDFLVYFVSLRRTMFDNTSLSTLYIGLDWAPLPALPHGSVGLKSTYKWTLTYTAHFDLEDGGSLYLWKINIIHMLERPTNIIDMNVNVIFS